MLNKVILQGRLTADPELRHTNSGTAVATFSLAVDRGFKKTSEEQQTVDFINIVAWRNTAEFVSKWFSKGRMALVEGRLQVRNYTDKEGNRRYVTEVVADNINFCGDRREGDNSGNSGNYGSYSTAPASYAPSAGQATANDAFAELNEDDGELPF